MGDTDYDKIINNLLGLEKYNVVLLGFKKYLDSIKEDIDKLKSEIENNKAENKRIEDRIEFVRR
ncbi:hypothetical protein [Candidatus Nanopusillus massiliensis]|uniref:hypothetical protein n=1 Tax=Candidatus Nanopusillus massiliensis TaxID=2897163 RepID=UPI001E4687B9|nr:hypothetical protein [Candidatus Nanopusillus massiliensis]